MRDILKTMSNIVLLNVLFCYMRLTSTMDPDTLDMLTPMQQQGEACGYLSCPDMVDNMDLNIHIVPHTHAELGYTNTFYGHYTGHDDYFSDSQINIKRILDFTISELWTKPGRKFTLSDNAYFFHWWANRDETVRRMVYQLLRQGRLYFVGGGWSMSDEATTSYHAIIDHFTYSLRKINATFLDCGRPLVGWQADVLGHSREFASLMAQMGFDGLFINPISYDDELARMRRNALEFIWRGSDDLGPESDMYTHKLFDGYWPPPGFCFGGQCDSPLIITSMDTFNNVNERIDEFVKLMKFRQAPYYTTRNLMVIMGLRNGYFDASVWFANIDKLIIHVNRRHSNIQAFYSTPACYLKAVYESNPQLQTKQDDFFPYGYDKDSYAVGMYTSRPALKLMARESHRFLQIAKQLQLTARLGNNDKLFEDFNWINGVFQDHNILSGQVRGSVVSYYMAIMSRSTNVVVDRILEKGFNTLRNSTSSVRQTMILCKWNISRCHCTAGPHYFIVIYNPLAWPVTIPVRLPISKIEQVVYNSKGKKVRAGLMQIPEPVQKLPGRNSSIIFELVFFAEDIPPMGIRSYYLQRHQTGWVRPARSLIKKIKNTTKKFLSHHADGSFFNEPDYEYFEDDDYEQTEMSPTKRLKPNILFSDQFSDVSTNEVLTPRVRKETTTNPDYEDTTTKDAATKTDAVTTTEADTSTEADTTTEAHTTTKSVLTTDAVITANTVKTTKDMTTADMTTIEAVTTTESITTTDAAITTDAVTTTDGVTTTEAAITIDKTTEMLKHFRSELKAQKQKAHESDLAHQEHAAMIQSSKGSDDEDDDMVDYWKGYPCYIVNEHSYIRNRYIRVNLDSKKRVVNVSVATGIKMSLNIQPYYYVSDDPLRLGKDKRPPGAYLFRTMDYQAEDIVNGLQGNVYKNDLVQELHLKYSDWASITLRVYRNSPVLELDWVVGPIPIEDGLGKEVLIKYQTDLVNEGVFYTDSNGRQTLKRIRNMRPMFEPVNQDPIAGNFYPVTSKIYIEDLKRNIRFAVLNDRSQGGSSLKDGEINMLLHRRLLTDDSGVNSILNETEYEKGTIIRGQHYIYISKADYKPYRVFEKKLAKEIELRPQILTSPAWGYGDKGKPIWESHNNEYSALKTQLPLGIHILTLEQWNEGTILLRLENFLEKADCMKSGTKRLHLANLFAFITITNVKETTLAGNMWLKEWVALTWNKDKFLKSFNDAYNTGKYSFAEDEGRILQEVSINAAIELRPQQIRTFVIWYQYK